MAAKSKRRKAAESEYEAARLEWAEAVDFWMYKATPAEKPAAYLAKKAAHARMMAANEATK